MDTSCVAFALRGFLLPLRCSVPTSDFSFFHFYSSLRFIYLQKFFFRESLLCLISLLDNFPVFYLYSTYFGGILIVVIFQRQWLFNWDFFLGCFYLLKKISHFGQECPFSCSSFSRVEIWEPHTWVLSTSVLSASITVTEPLLPSPKTACYCI